MASLRTTIAKLDCQFMLWVARYRKAPLILFFKSTTYTAVGKAWFGTAIVLSLANRFGFYIVENQTVFLHALFAPLLTWVLGRFIKGSFKRQRPFQCMPNYTSLVDSPKDDSFPSLHAGSTVSFFFALFILQHSYAPWVGLWALLASFSRLYLGVHFLSDVLAGAVLGFICSWLMFLI